MPYAYDLDTTGVKPENLIENERHTVTSANDKDYTFIIPVAAPFFSESVKLYLEEGTNLTLLTEGVDYGFSLHFQSASKAIAKPIYAGISFFRELSSAQILVTYQTVGGEWTLDQAKMSETLANIIYNPRGLTWEEVTNIQKLFPPVAHIWDYRNMVGQEGPTKALNDIAQAIASKPQSQGQAQTPVTKTTIGLGRVENYPPASVQETIAGTKDDAVITPAALKAALQALGLLECSDNIKALSDHIKDKNNPHQTTADSVGLGYVENLPVATAGDILAKRQVRKYLTLDMFFQFKHLYGCTPGKDEAAFAPKGALAATYCTPSFINMGVYHNGQGGTYEEVIELDSKRCGYREPPKVQNPTRGSILDRFCDQLGDLWGYVADGNGNATTQLLQKQSSECNKAPTPQPGPNYPAAGTFIRKECKGKDLYHIVADGKGGEKEEFKQSNSADCGGATPPPPTPQPNQKSIVYTSVPTTFKEGDTEVMTIKLSGFTPNTTVKLNGYLKHPNYNNGQKKLTPPLVDVPVTIDSSGNGTYVYHNTATGISNVFTMFQESGNTVSCENWFEADGVESNHVTRTFIRQSTPGLRPNISFTINGSNNSQLKIGNNATLAYTFSGFKPNSTVNYYLKIRGDMDNRDEGQGTFKITVDSTGKASASFSTTLARDTTIRGRHVYIIVASYTDNDGKTKEVQSESAIVTFIDNPNINTGVKKMWYETNTPILGIGTVETQTVQLSGYPANSTTYITFWHESGGMSARETHMANIAVQIDARGNGSYSYSSGAPVDQATLDFLWDATGTSRTIAYKTFWGWVKDQYGTKSNTISRTFRRSSV